jgi:surface polysaccharide O-acyltransferase-like enzyme
VLLGLFAWANRKWRGTYPAMAWLAANAFGAFILHPPVTVALSVLAAPWDVAPLAKFVVVGAAACGGSFVLAGALRMLPGVHRVV